MAGWAGIALALRGPGDDAMRSRLPTYVHPLAGHSLAWHPLRAIAELAPPPQRLFLVGGEWVGAGIIGDLPAEALDAGPDGWWAGLVAGLDAGIESLLVVDAAAATLDTSLEALFAGPAGRVLRAPDGEPVAVWADRERIAAGASPHPSLEELARGLVPLPIAGTAEGVIVRDRASLARANGILRDRIVRRLLDGGVTVLLPETVLADVDVRVGTDSVIYPGVILEGRTVIGSETVVGPGCRIIDSWIGSGVELKGWNYIVGANIRNRAVLEPYVRRGFD